MKNKNKVAFYNNGVPACVASIKDMDMQTILRLGILNLNKYATLAGVTSEGLGNSWQAFRDGFHAIKKEALNVGLQALLSAESVSVTDSYTVNSKGHVRTSGRVTGRGLSEGVLHEKATLKHKEHKKALDSWLDELVSGKVRPCRVLSLEAAENEMLLPVSKAISLLVADHKSRIPVQFMDGNKVDRKALRQFLTDSEVATVESLKREKERKAKERKAKRKATPAEAKASRSATREAAIVKTA